MEQKLVLLQSCWAVLIILVQLFIFLKFFFNGIIVCCLCFVLCKAQEVWQCKYRMNQMPLHWNKLQLPPAGWAHIFIYVYLSLSLSKTLSFPFLVTAWNTSFTAETHLLQLMYFSSFRLPYYPDHSTCICLVKEYNIRRVCLFLCQHQYGITVDWFYIALFSALEQTHCACMWFYMSKWLSIARFDWTSTKAVYLKRFSHYYSL